MLVQVFTVLTAWLRQYDLPDSEWKQNLLSLQVSEGQTEAGPGKLIPQYRGMEGFLSSLGSRGEAVLWKDDWVGNYKFPVEL